MYANVTRAKAYPIVMPSLAAKGAKSSTMLLERSGRTKQSQHAQWDLPSVDIPLDKNNANILGVVRGGLQQRDSSLEIVPVHRTILIVPFDPTLASVRRIPKEGSDIELHIFFLARMKRMYVERPGALEFHNPRSGKPVSLTDLSESQALAIKLYDEKIGGFANSFSPVDLDFSKICGRLYELNVAPRITEALTNGRFKQKAAA